FLVYSYSSCGVCDRVKAWLSEKEILYELIEEPYGTKIIKNPPSTEQLAAWAVHLDKGVETFISKHGRIYRDLELKGTKHTDEEWLELIKRYPRILRRPIITNGEHTVVGYRKEQLEECFG